MTKKSKRVKKDNKKLKAFIASFLTIIGFILAILLWKKDKYIMFYAKQGLILFLGQVLVGLISEIPFIGWFLFGPILWVFWAILWFITWINALSGQQRRTFIVGDLADKIAI